MVRRRKQSSLAYLGGIIEKNKNSRIGRIACTLCDHYIMGSSVYVFMLGLIGTVITVLDIIRIIYYKRPDRSAPRSTDDEAVRMDVDRDVKLMISILGIEHYSLIILGVLTEYPMLHTQWLLMQLCVIILEVIVFFVRLFLDGLHMKRDQILLAMLTVHNWLQVFCLFHRQARQPN